MGTEHLGNKVDSGQTSYTPLPSDQNATNSKAAAPTLFAPSDALETSLNQFSPFSFGQNGQHVYEAAGQHAVLPIPQEGEISDDVMGKMEQLLINSHFISDVKARLKGENIDGSNAKQILKYIQTGKKQGLSSKLIQLADEIAKNAASETKTAMGLTAEWNPQSNPKTWQTKPPVTYDADERSEIDQFFDSRLKETTNSYIATALSKTPPALSQTKVSALKTALASNNFDPLLGPDPQLITPHYVAIRKQAVQATQTQYNLPISWAPGAQASQYAAVNASPLAPAKVQTAKFTQLFTNVQQLATDYTKTIEKLKTDPNKALQNAAASPDGADVIQFMKAILSSLTSAKKILNELQVEDAELTQKLSASKFDTSKERIKQETSEWQNTMDQMDKAEKAAKKQEKFGGIMKILSPCVAALAFVVAAIVTVGTLGAGVGVGAMIAIGGLVLAGAMLAYTIADSVLNLSPGVNKAIVGAFNSAVSWIASTFHIPEKAAQAILLLFVAALIIAAVVLTGGSAAAEAGGEAAEIGAQTAAEAAAEAAQVAMQTGMQALKAAISQVVMQLLMVIVMSPDSGVAALIISFIPNASDKLKLIIQMIVMVVFMVGIMIAGAYKQAGSSVTNVLKQGAESVKASIESVINTIKTAVVALIKGIAVGLEEGIAKMGSNIASGLKQAGKEAAEEFLAMLQEITKDVKGSQAIQAWARRAELGGNLAMQGMQIGKGVAMASLDSSLASLMGQLGQIQAAEDLLQGTIQMLEKMIQKMQQAMSGIGDDVETVQNLLKHAFLSSGQSFEKLATGVNPA